MKYFILVLFILMYILIIAFPKFKPYFAGGIAIISIVSLLISGARFLSIFNLESFLDDLNVLLMLSGIMLTVYFFSESKMPNKIADKMMGKISNSLMALVLLSVISGVISAFIDNVATVLMLAPIGFAVAKKIGVSPVPVIISIAVSSNLQGAATLVGDTTSIMLASERYANMGFFDFFFSEGKFSIFWAVEIGAIATIPVLLFVFRKNNKKLRYISDGVEVTSIVPSILLVINFILLVLCSFIQDKPVYTNGVICMVIGIISFIFYSVKFKCKFVDTVKNAIDFSTVIFIASLFIMIKAVIYVGIIDDIANVFFGIGNTNIFLLYTVIVFGSVIVSAFVDNIPYVATMLPVISALSLGLSVNPKLLYFGLLLGATLGGNITPVGASANVVGIGLLNKEGINVKNSDFFKIGIPFTLVAVLSGYIFCFLIWA